MILISAFWGRFGFNLLLLFDPCLDLIIEVLKEQPLIRAELFRFLAEELTFEIVELTLKIIDLTEKSEYHLLECLYIRRQLPG